MRLTYDQMMMMMEDSKGDLIKASVVRSLITSLQYHNYNRHKKHSYSASTFTIPEDPHLYTLRNYSCSPLLLKVIKKNHICKFYKDSDEQYHIIYENFINLYKLYTPHGSRLNNEKPEIFSSYVQQFFLDKGLLTDVLFKVVISICKKEPWVDIKLFTECIEAFQINLFEGMYYFFREPSLEIKVNIELQKLLFFFEFIDVQDKNKLNFLQVCDVFRIALKKIKESEVTSRANEVFQKVNAKKKTMVQYVSFEEFYLTLC